MGGEEDGMRWFGLVALILLAASACKPKEYICSTAEECVASSGGHGLCLASHCAYTDSACASGWRFDDTAGSVANDCADPSLLVADAGVPDATPGDAATDDGGAADATVLDAVADDAPVVVDAAPMDVPSGDAL